MNMVNEEKIPADTSLPVSELFLKSTKRSAIVSCNKKSRKLTFPSSTTPERTESNADAAVKTYKSS